jgi:hypothetical protein
MRWASRRMDGAFYRSGEICGMAMLGLERLKEVHIRLRRSGVGKGVAFLHFGISVLYRCRIKSQMERTITVYNDHTSVNVPQASLPTSRLFMSGKPSVEFDRQMFVIGGQGKDCS